MTADERRLPRRIQFRWHWRSWRHCKLGRAYVRLDRQRRWMLAWSCLSVTLIWPGKPT